MPDPLSWINDELAALESRDLRRRLRVRRGMQSGKVELDGRELINFGANDYLGLAGDERLVRAVRETANRDGWGAGASPLVSGRSDWHAQLEHRLAQFEGCEAALVFGSGFAANSATIPALVGEGDVIFADALNHASLIDGCRLAKAELRIYPHVDVRELSVMLGKAGGFRRRLIVTDTLFSMDGDLAPLAELGQLAEASDSMLMIDEAHATGVFGARGRGLAEEMGVERHVHIKVGTLSKALGSVGGFVAGRQTLIDWLANRARAYVFSTAPPAAMCAAALTALDIVEHEPQRRRELLARAAELRVRLSHEGWTIGTTRSQIIPLIVGEPATALAMNRGLEERGLFVPAIRPPSVPVGRALLRISLSWSHTPAMIDQLVAVLGEVRATR